MTSSVFLVGNHSNTWLVLQLWRWLATKVHITYLHAYPPEKNISQKKSIVALLSTSVGLSACIVYHGDSLILCNKCASVSSAISSICLVMVLAERGAHATFWIAASPKGSQQMSSAAGRMNSSPIVNGFLALAMWSATRNDALSADTLDEMAAFNNCFWSCWGFFLLKNSKGLPLN